MIQFKMQVKLNVLPLGSYDVLIGIDWLKKHQVILNCFQKQISSWQIKTTVRKGCKLFGVHVINNEQMDKQDKLKFDDISILQDFSDVFSEEIPGLPLKRELNFTIESVPGVVPNSKAPYRMNIL